MEHKPNIDIVMLSWAKDDTLIEMTKNSIASLQNSEPNLDMNIILMESSCYPWHQMKHYDNVKVVNTIPPFSYNASMNAGIRMTNSEYIYIANNDLEYTNKCLSNMINKGYDSMSAKCSRSPTTRTINKDTEGYIVGKLVTGWGIMFKRSVWEAIGGLDECVNFYCSDNCYSSQIEQLGIKHYLIADSIINHLGHSNTLNTVDKSMYDELTMQQVRIYNTKYKKNIFNLNPENND